MNSGLTDREIRPVFSSFLSPEFEVSVSLAGTNEALHSILDRSPVVEELRQSLQSEAVADEEVRAFVNGLLRTFRPGVLFAYDLVLAAIAVALCRRRTRFASEYISDLAQLKSSELRRAVAIARLVRRNRSHASRTIGRSMTMESRLPSNIVTRGPFSPPVRLVMPVREACADARQDLPHQDKGNAQTRVFSSM